MASYRDSSFDPNAYQRPGPPMRPYNWVQWSGFGLALVGVAVFLAYLAGRAGWIRNPLDSPTPGAGFLLIGSVLINSRRQPGSGELRSTSRRTLIAIAVALAAFAIALAAVLYFQGAK
jgi:hypothetical protein